MRTIYHAFNYQREVPAVLAELELPVMALSAVNAPTDRESLSKHGVEAVVLPESDHFMAQVKPREFNAALVSIVKGFDKTKEQGK